MQAARFELPGEMPVDGDGRDAHRKRVNPQTTVGKRPPLADSPESIATSAALLAKALNSDCTNFSWGLARASNRANVPDFEDNHPV